MIKVIIRLFRDSPSQQEGFLPVPSPGSGDREGVVKKVKKANKSKNLDKMGIG